MESQGGGAALRALLVLCLLLVASIGHAQSSTIGFPTKTCTGGAPLANGTGLPGMPGVWNDPYRYGSGWDLQYYIVPADGSTQLAVTWFTYDHTHHPVWLSAGPATFNTVSGQWAATLNKVTWAQSNNNNNGGVSYTPVGNVAIVFAPGYVSSASLRWSWPAEYPSPAVAPDECINNVISSQAGALPALATLGGIDQSYSGEWFDSGHSGWGLSEAIGALPAGNVEVQTLEIYDITGQPVWLENVFGPQSTPISDRVLTQTLAYLQSTYAMNTDCTDASCRVSGQPNAGSVTRVFPSNQTETFTVYASVSNAFAPHQITWPNPAMTFPNNQVAPATYSPEIATSTLTKLSVDDYLFVNQTYCALSGTNSTCPIVVSWINNTDGTARVYERDVTNGANGPLVTPSTNNNGTGCVASPSLAISTAYTGSVNVCVPLSQPGNGTKVVQFELRSSSSVGSLIHTSPQVTIVPPPAVQAASFVAYTIPPPTTMQAGQTANVQVTMMNTGSSAWSDATGYKLWPVNPPGNTTWTTTRAPLPAGTSVAPGQSYTFSFSITAPSTGGTYNFQWQMLQEGVNGFGALTTLIPITVSQAAQASVCGAETINGTTLTGGLLPGNNPKLIAGQTYPATVVMQNTGTATWTAAALYGLQSQNPPNNPTWVSSGRVPLPASVASGQSVTFSFNIVAPPPGLYYYQWQMVQDGGVGSFGSLCAIQDIQVLPVPIPSAPPAVTPSPNGSVENSPSFNLTWGPGSTSSNPAPTYYQLQYATAATGPWTTLNNNILAMGSSNVYGVTVPTNGTYYFQVAACIPTGCSSYTESSAVVVTATIAGVLANPAGFTGAWPGFQFGLPGDTPFVMQLNGTLIPVLFRPGSTPFWYFNTGGFVNYNAATTQVVQFGLTGDVPQIIRMSGVDRIAVYRPSTNQVFMSLDNQTAGATNVEFHVPWSPLIPATVSQIVSTPSAFNGAWYDFSFGLTGDTPLLIQLTPGGGKLPILFRPSNPAYWYINTAGYVNYDSTQTQVIQFGLPTDQPEVVYWNNADHIAVYRASTQQTIISTDNQTFTGSNAVYLGPCTDITVTPAPLNFTSAGGAQTVTVKAPAACGWTLTNPSAWLTSSPASGTGNGAVTLTATANATGAARSGTLVFSGNSGSASVLVSQASSAAPSVPAAVTDVTVPATSSSGVFNVYWTRAASDGATYYVVQQATGVAGPWAQVGSNIAAPASSTAVTVAATSTQTFYYQVAACNANGCSPYRRGTNVAAASAGGSVTASSTYVGTQQFPVSAVIDGDHTGANWGNGNGGGWADNTPNVFPDTVTLTFSAQQTIQSVIVYTLQDNFAQGVDPSDTLTFANFGLTAFDVRNGSGTSGTLLGSVTSNNLVKRTVNFTPLTTNQITVVTNASIDGYSRIVEVEALHLAMITVTPTGVTLTPPTLPPAAGTVNDLPTHDATVGTMAGKAGTDGGAAQYSVPIDVPPGRAGMQPSLSLNYNSRSGNGVMGMGWTISGLSSIHRCPQTPEQDGVTLGVSYTNTDRLCLDGQRLVAITGNYGAANTVYRTEVDSYARITQIGGDLTSTSACFRVEQKDGRVLHYGAVTGALTSGALPVASSSTCATSAANSRVTPSGASAPLAWQVEKIEDRVGNNQLYQYANSVTNTSFGPGEVLLSKVTYTGFGTALGNRTVTFAYTSRTLASSGTTDISSSYLAGGLTMQTQALASITTAVNGTTARTYTPAYTTASYNQRLTMTSLQECAGSTCHPASQFSYNDGGLNYPFGALANINATLPAGAMPESVLPVADFDGDGARELQISAWDPAHIVSYAFLAQIRADQSVQNVVDLSGTPFGTNTYADIDGDGRSKLVLPVFTAPGSPPISGVVSFGVWNGGRGQAAAQVPGVTTPCTEEVNCPTNNFNALFQTVPSNIAVMSDDAIYVADMNGDGKPDIVVKSTHLSGCSSGGAGVYVYLNTLTTTLANTSGPVAFQGPIGPLFCLSQVQGSGGADDVTVPMLDHIADFNGDGIPDFYITSTNQHTGVNGIAGVYKTGVSGTGSGTTFSSTLITCTAMNLTANECQFQGSPGYSGAAARYVRWIDVNGDGLEDLVLGNGGGQWVVHLNQGNGSLTAAINTGSTVGLNDKTYNGSLRYANKLPIMDVDGDGKSDLVIPRSSTLDGSGNVVTSGFAARMCTAKIVVTVPPDNNNCAGASTGATAALRAPLTATVPTLSCVAYACPEEPGVTDSQGKGIANLPQNLSSDASVYTLVQTDQYAQRPAAMLYTSQTFAGVGVSDYSAYHLDMLKFVQTGPSAISVLDIPTPLISGLNNGASLTTPSDLAGNGLSSAVTTLGCPRGTITVNSPSSNIPGYYPGCSVVGGAYGPAALPDGTLTAAFEPVQSTSGGHLVYTPKSVLYANLNQGVAPTGLMTAAKDAATQLLGGTNPIETGACPAGIVLPGLLTSATNGVGDTAVWGYDPLGFGLLCTRDGIPQYTIKNPLNNTGSGYVDLRHYYFGSSMPVVSAMLQSNGIGGTTGARSAIYGYSEAMYNHFGRGFQGFRTITTENASADAPRRLTTTTTFKQKFPLVGKVETVTTKPAASSGIAAHPIHAETNTYLCVQSDATLATCPQDPTALLPIPTGTTVYQPVVSNQSTYDCDLSGVAAPTCDGTANTPTANRVGHSSTANSSWDLYGNLLMQTTIRGDDAAGGTFITSHTVTTTNTYDTTDTTDWWVNKLTESNVLNQISYASGHSLPTGALAPDQTVDTLLSWNTDRTPAFKVLQNNLVNQQSVTAYTYPSTSYGLPASVTISATGLDTHGVPKTTYDLAAALNPTRTTSYTYTKDGTTLAADGYFVFKATNALGQTTTVNVQPSDGQVTKAIAPNAITTTTTYDAFGRATLISSPIASPIQIAYTSCTSGTCSITGAANPGAVSEDSNETNAAYRVTTTQQGYPTKAAWIDPLGRTVKQAAASFSGTESTKLDYAFSATLTEYDEQGTVAMQSTPYFVSSGTPYYTAFTYDALSRPLTKSAQNACGSYMTTSYQYVGRQTNIQASGTCSSGGTANSAIKMSRSTNVLGQLMQTVDANGNTTYANGKTTSYWTEPLGHVVAMTDVEGNRTRASYNALGQRTQSVDPDQGTWNFTYDAFGELVTQTDARLAVTQVLSRDAVGRPLTRSEIPPASVPAGEAGGSWLDTWTYDQSNGSAATVANGQVGQIVRQRGTGSPLSSNPVVWQEIYSYDTNARPSAIATTVAEDASVPLTSTLSYDGNGRLATYAYPSGLVVQHTYTAYGELDALSNAGTGSVYWIAQAQNQWGHLTQEQYPGLITGSHSDYDATGQGHTLSWSGTVADTFTYQYDSFGNLHQQARTNQAGYTETYAYDSLQRLIMATRNGTPVNYSYSASGNLTGKSDYGATYSYATANTHDSLSGCGPHAAISAGTNTYVCDANGNVIGGNTIAVIYDQENFARTASRASAGTTLWAHDTNGKLDYSWSSSLGSRYYGPAGYEQVGTGAGAKQIHELGPVIVTRVNGTDSLSVTLRDRLGSTVDVIDNNTPTTRTYDAFGQPLLGNGNDNGGVLGLTDTLHGFTQHEHDDDTLLINMEGRIYDYRLGRFLQVDPIIGNPASSQSLNPYSYIGNNPLSGKDPTGYQCVGSNIQSQTCADTGASVTQVGSPSVSDAKAWNDAIHSGPPAPSSSGSVVTGPAIQGGTTQSGIGSGTAQQNGNGTPAKDAPEATVSASGPTAHERAGEISQKLMWGGNFVGAEGVHILDSLFTDAGTLQGKYLGYDHNTWTGNSFNDPDVGLKAAAGIGMMILSGGEAKPAIQELETVVVRAVADLRAAGLKDAHHIIQDAAVRNLPGYTSGLAPGVQLRGPSTEIGSPHYLATQVQRQAGGGTYAAERRIGYRALRAAGLSEGSARQAISAADTFFEGIGVTSSTETRVPGNRN